MMNSISLMKKLSPIHPVRSQAKVQNLVDNFDEELASPILVGTDGNLLNGTHRYRAYQIREMKGLTPNFNFVFIEDLDKSDSMVSQLLSLIDSLDLSEGADNTSIYIDIDDFWNDNWFFITSRRKTTHFRG